MDKKRLKQKVKKVIGIVFLGIFLAIFWLIKTWPEEELKVVFCDVGQGDAILLTQENYQVLIDGGPGSQVLSCLGENIPFWDQKIELVVLTHPDADHVTGLVEVFRRFEVEQFVGSGFSSNSAVFKEFLKVLEGEDSAVFVAHQGDQIEVGEMSFKFVWPAPGAGSRLAYQSKNQVLGASSDTNKNSLVSLLSFGDFDLLLTGDITFSEEDKIQWGSLPKIEVLKVAHHGSKYSTGADLLSQIRPYMAVISAGKNPWGHPTDEVLNRLGEAGIKVKRTDLEGSIQIVTNGHTWSIK